MKVNITGRKIDLTDKIKETTLKKILKLEKFFGDDASAQVTYTAQKDKAAVEVTVFHGGMIYRGEDMNSDKYVALDKVVDIIERQIRKNKTRLEKKLRENAFDAYAGAESEVPEEKEFKIVKTKKYFIKPMSPEEAILQMNLIGHEFYLFKNAETEENNIVYRRKDGNYGLIETE